MTAADIKPDSRFFGLIVGESSTGKDCAIASFPKPMLILDSDLRKGIIAARKWIPDEEFKQIHIEPFNPSKGFADYDKKLMELESQFRTNSCPFKTIVLNSITSLDRIIMTDALEYQGGNVVGPKDAQGRLLGKGVRLSGPADYKYQKAAFLAIFDYLRSFPTNVVIVGHTVPRYEETGDGQYSQRVQVGTRLSLTERLANDLLIYFDEAYEFSKSSDGRSYYVQFRTSIARTCWDSLPYEKLNITGKNFYETWKSSLKL